MHVIKRAVVVMAIFFASGFGASQAGATPSQSPRN